jgi:hypothetical protein
VVTSHQSYNDTFNYGERSPTFFKFVEYMLATANPNSHLWADKKASFKLPVLNAYLGRAVMHSHRPKWPQHVRIPTDTDVTR